MEIITYLLFVALILLQQILHSAACSSLGNWTKYFQTLAVFMVEPPILGLECLRVPPTAAAEVVGNA